MPWTLPEPELRAWLRFMALPLTARHKINQLILSRGSADEAWRVGAAAWRRTGLTEDHIALLQTFPEGAIRKNLEWLSAEHHHFLTPSMANYPALLKEIDNPPPGLFAKGTIACMSKPGIAVVGSRQATKTGLHCAREFVGALVNADAVIISGLAQGIDGAAHRAALEAGGNTVAVCATGLDIVYPRAHQDLADAIAAQGLLLGEFLLGTQPRAYHFPYRNRIISGISLGTLVVEAGLRSGSLITARLAAEQGREVFAVPGSIHNPQSGGCHCLIKEGAKLVECIEDVLEELRWGGNSKTARLSPRTEIDLSVCNATQRAILEALRPGSHMLPDDIVRDTGLAAAAVAGALLELELQGYVIPEAGNSYVLAPGARLVQAPATVSDTQGLKAIATRQRRT